MDSLKCVEYVDEKRTISAYYHEKLRSGTRVGTIALIKRVHLDNSMCVLQRFSYVKFSLEATANSLVCKKIVFEFFNN